MPEFADLSVLVVDPNPNMRQIVRSMLRSAGIHHVVQAQDGKEALKMHRHRAFDAMITEWDMPGLHGKRLIWTVRRDSSKDRHRIPILVLAADSSRKTVTAARDAGAHAFMQKPVSSRNLSRRIDDIVNRPRGFVETKSYVGPDRRFFASSAYSGEDRRNEQADAAS